MDIEQAAIETARMAANMSLKLYSQPIAVCDSGGKDSAVLVRIFEKSGVPFIVQHNHTTADAPETVYFMRQKLAKLETQGIPCAINYPSYKGARTSMWQLIPLKGMPPTRVVRYCCDILKEQSGAYSFIATGVRWEESYRRSINRGLLEVTGPKKSKIILTNDNDENRRTFETCALKGRRVCNPIIGWSDRNVWDYIHAEKLDINPLYSQGFARVGCVGCPMAGKRRYKEFAYWPKYEKLYLNAFQRMIEERERRGKMEGTWLMGNTAESVMHWWMEDGYIQGQISMEDILNAE